MALEPLHPHYTVAVWVRLKLTEFAVKMEQTKTTKVQ